MCHCFAPFLLYLVQPIETPEHPRRLPSRQGKAVYRTVDAVRIAIGKKIIRSKCQLTLDLRHEGQGFLNLSYAVDSGAKRGQKKKAKAEKHKIRCDDDSIQELVYYIADDDDDQNGNRSQQPFDLATPHKKSQGFDESEHMSFLAIRVEPNNDNGLKSIKNSYLQSLQDTHSRAEEKKYVVIEVRSDKDFNELIDEMRKDQHLNTFLSSGRKLSKKEVAVYATSLIKDSQKEKKERESSATRRTRSSTRNRGRDKEVENELLVIYPFPMNEKVRSEVTKDLDIAKTVPFLEAKSHGQESSLDENMHGPKPMSEQDSETDPEKDASENEKGKNRTHVLTIRSEDRARLMQGEFLNDTLIDFWMKW